MGEGSLVKLDDFQLHKILEGQDAPISLEEKRQDLAFWIRRYLAERVAGVGSPHTWRAKARDLTHFYRFFTEWNQSSLITHWRRRDTEAFREELLRRGYKPATVNRLLATVKHFGRYCEEQRAFPGECPVSGVKNVPFEEPEPKGLDRSEVHRLFKSIEDLVRMNPGWEAARDESILHLLYGTGRRGHRTLPPEGQKLRWQVAEELPDQGRPFPGPLRASGRQGET
ncbi:site-specific integrase [Acidobacteria bacterium AH-259-A15]|nr:site-specific integrase [Acidobacteria bacterium AH-259-A15]